MVILVYRIGIDIGGTKVKIGLVNESNQIVSEKKLYIKDITDLALDLKNNIHNMCDELNIDRSQIKSVGIGIPGTVSDDGKKILKAPNISILSDDIACQMEDILNIPVTLVQDSRAAAWGEYLCGGAKGAKVAVCITLGTGIGTGIVVNGNIFGGGLGSAGEMGHIPVSGGTRKCGCGKVGCVEKYVAGGGLDITASEILGEGKNASDLFVEAKAGNEKAINAINAAVEMLGGVIVSVVNLLSPDCILFSGGLSNQEEMYLNPVISYVNDHCYSSGKLPVLKKAELGENAPMVGAALIG